MPPGMEGEIEEGIGFTAPRALVFFPKQQALETVYWGTSQ